MWWIKFAVFIYSVLNISEYTLTHIRLFNHQQLQQHIIMIMCIRISQKLSHSHHCHNIGKMQLIPKNACVCVCVCNIPPHICMFFLYFSTYLYTHVCYTHIHTKFHRKSALLSFLCKNRVHLCMCDAYLHILWDMWELL